MELFLMPDTTRSTYHAVVVALAPAVLAVSLVGHPYLSGRLPNDTEVAEAVVDSTTRWGLVHLAAGVASGLVILTFRRYLRDAGDDRFSARRRAVCRLRQHAVRPPARDGV